MSEPLSTFVRPERPPIVLIVDDQEWTLRSLETFLAPNGFAVMRAFTGAKGFERAVAHTPDIVVIDADLPDMTGAPGSLGTASLSLFGVIAPAFSSNAASLTVDFFSCKKKRYILPTRNSVLRKNAALVFHLTRSNCDQTTKVP